MTWGFRNPIRHTHHGKYFLRRHTHTRKKIIYPPDWSWLTDWLTNLHTNTPNWAKTLVLVGENGSASQPSTATLNYYTIYVCLCLVSFCNAGLFSCIFWGVCLWVCLCCFAGLFTVLLGVLVCVGRFCFPGLLSFFVLQVHIIGLYIKSLCWTAKPTQWPDLTVVVLLKHADPVQRAQGMLATRYSTYRPVPTKITWRIEVNNKENELL